MGNKVNPIGFRLGISAGWSSRWYAEGKRYAEYLYSDWELRRDLKKRLERASVSRVEIERQGDKVEILVHTARPGMVIGKRGEDIERLQRDLRKRLGTNNVRVAVEEIRKPELDAQLVAEAISQQLERRIMFRRAMRRAVGNAMRLGAHGIKVRVAGRLNGAEIARSEWYREGRVPLHTLRADIDYGTAEAHTTYGIIGVKVWISKGEILDPNALKERQAASAAKPVVQTQEA
ncbi:MAG: 30S ribosomal protein S3 [Gammaproteobacteria bacterium]